ncbi:MAG: YraN family protein [Patescibacteria group bacterium]|nr:YraN family protein [Patescibacteria group bacterium]
MIIDANGLNTRTVGRFGEDIAARYLEREGLSVVRRNYLKKWGEIDIIAMKGSEVCFFEVKSVTRPLVAVGSGDHRPEDNVHQEKARRIRRMIQTFFFEQGMGTEERFSFHVLCVYMDMSKRCARVKWIKDVVL